MRMRPFSPIQIHNKVIALWISSWVTPCGYLLLLSAFGREDRVLRYMGGEREKNVMENQSHLHINYSVRLAIQFSWEIRDYLPRRNNKLLHLTQMSRWAFHVHYPHIPYNSSWGKMKKNVSPISHHQKQRHRSRVLTRCQCAYISMCMVWVFILNTAERSREMEKKEGWVTSQRHTFGLWWFRKYDAELANSSTAEYPCTAFQDTYQ